MHCLLACQKCEKHFLWCCKNRVVSLSFSVRSILWVSLLEKEEIRAVQANGREKEKGENRGERKLLKKILQKRAAVAVRLSYVRRQFYGIVTYTQPGEQLILFYPCQVLSKSGQEFVRPDFKAKKKEFNDSFFPNPSSFFSFYRPIYLL